MKTNFKTRTSPDYSSGFYIKGFILINKTIFTLLTGAFLISGLTATAHTRDCNKAHSHASSNNLTDTTPVVKIIADYCVVPGNIRLTASSTTPGATYLWSTGQTGSVINVDIANFYSVVATFSNGKTATATRKVAEELVTNGDFSDGNTGFYTEYGYTDDVPGNTELYPEGLYSVGNNGQNYHNLFYGRDHTTAAQTGNFMIINGSTRPIGDPPRQRIIWQQTVSVARNTNYYFSAWAMNINPGSPAQLQFEVNGVRVGTIADLDVAPKPYSDATVNINNWVRFYSNPTWNSGSASIAEIRIINLNTDASGNDFGLDDISFSTLAPFITLESDPGTDAQTTCINSTITPIVYSVGSDSSGHSITGLPAGVTASFSQANYLILSGSPTVAGNYTYSITTIGTCNPVTVTGTINIPSSWNSWSGAVSTDWSDPNNWSCSVVPTNITDVIIPSGLARMPMLTTVSVCRKMDMQTGTSLDLNGQSFTNYGGITGSGLFKGSVLSNLTIAAANTTSVVKFDQSVPGTSNALNNLSITGVSNAVLLNTRLALYGILSPQDGTFTINDTLVLRSTNRGTAGVDVVTGAFAYGTNGKVEVERYFSARRSWRLVTSPLTKTGSIFDSWQNGGKYVAGKGTYVSGATATNPVGVNGLDWSPMNNTSLKMGMPYAAVTNTHINLSKNAADTSDNIAYFMFVRGDRDPANTSTAVSNNTTLSSDGRLQTGRQTFTATATAGGFTFIGNPYASPVDFNKLVLKNVKKHFWAWDPYLNTDQGGYVLVEEISTGAYDMIPHSPGGMNQLLQSSQGFFVETIAAGPASVTFQETAKSATTANLTAFRPMGPTQSFRANFYHLNENENTVLLDGVMVLFDTSFSKSVDNDDVLKSSNPKETVALVRDSKTLTLERRPLTENNDTLFLRLTKTTQRKYRLEFEPAGLEPTLTAFLEDSYTGKKTMLSITGNSVYDFEINGEAASANINRFMIVFKQATLLPVTFHSISAKQQAADIIVDWKVENEINIKKYEVEKSADGVDFKKVNTTIATGAGSTTVSYQWIDQSPFAGNNYYKIKSISQDAKAEYSKTVLVKTIQNTNAGISVFPNPVTGNDIEVSFKDQPSGMYEVKLTDALGQVIVTKKVDHSTATSLEKIQGNKMPPGVYQLEVIRQDQHIATVKVMVQ